MVRNVFKGCTSQLTRIKIDLENIADEDWQVDVKKSNISVPEDARIPLQKLQIDIGKFRKKYFIFEPDPVIKGKI